MICGPTGSGKTSLARPLLEKRKSIIALFNKASDKTADDFGPPWERVKTWPRFGLAPEQRRVLLWPTTKGSVEETTAHHAEVFRHAINQLHVEGHRAIYSDETLYVTNQLGLGKAVEYFHYFGRSNGITCITSQQRPRWVPKIIMSSVSHAYISRTFDPDDLKYLANLGGVDSRELAHNVANLPNRYSFVYVNTQGDGPSSIVNTRW